MPLLSVNHVKRGQADASDVDWGLIGAALVLLYGLLSLFGPDPAFLAAPIAVQEMVFALWLIVKGFNTVAHD